MCKIHIHKQWRGRVGGMGFHSVNSHALPWDLVSHCSITVCRIDNNSVPETGEYSAHEEFVQGFGAAQNTWSGRRKEVGEGRSSLQAFSLRLWREVRGDAAELHPPTPGRVSQWKLCILKSNPGFLVTLKSDGFDCYSKNLSFQQNHRVSLCHQPSYLHGRKVCATTQWQLFTKASQGFPHEGKEEAGPMQCKEKWRNWQKKTIVVVSKKREESGRLKGWLKACFASSKFTGAGRGRMLLLKLQNLGWEAAAQRRALQNLEEQPSSAWGCSLCGVSIPGCHLYPVLQIWEQRQSRPSGQNWAPPLVWTHSLLPLSKGQAGPSEGAGIQFWFGLEGLCTLGLLHWPPWWFLLCSMSRILEHV